MNKLHIENFSLENTLLSGQTFDWDYENGWFYGFAKNRAIKLKKEGDILLWQTYPRANDIVFLKTYLRHDVDYINIIAQISKDRHIKTAIKEYPSLRLLKQDFTETLLSFIISANNNIRAVRNIIRRMNRDMGRRVLTEEKEIYLFPELKAIAYSPLAKLRSYRMGFRAKYLKAAARYIIRTDLHKKINKMDEERARNELKKIPGVGDKIADCVLAYALGFDNVTPLDVWGKRIAYELYGLDPRMKYAQTREWFGKYFNGYAAWAGQFLFEHIRKTHRASV